MLFGILNYRNISENNFISYKSRFWSKYNLPNIIQNKNNKYIVIWDTPQAFELAVVSECFAFFLLFLAMLHYSILKVMRMTFEPLWKIRMLYILEHLFIFKTYYKRMQKRVQRFEECSLDDTQEINDEYNEYVQQSEIGGC